METNTTPNRASSARSPLASSGPQETQQETQSPSVPTCIPSRPSDAPQQGVVAQGQTSSSLSWRAKIKTQLPNKVQMTIIGFASLLIAMVGLGPGFQGAKYGVIFADLAGKSLSMDKWQAQAIFRSWCNDEKVRNLDFTATILALLSKSSHIIGRWSTIDTALRRGCSSTSTATACY
jgi:hypothetical protein